LSKSPMDIIREWFEEGTDEPKSFIDIKWYVIDEDRDDSGNLRGFRVSNARFPINLLVLDLEALSDNPEASVPAIRLVIETGVKTVDLERDTKLALYRELLNEAKMPFVTFYLFGIHDEIAVAADVDKRSLTREELEDILKSLILALLSLTSNPTIREQLMSEAYHMLLVLMAKWLREGLTREQMLDRLRTAGLDEDVAKALVDLVFELASQDSESRKRGKNDFLHI